jgi:hypothetical protein
LLKIIYLLGWVESISSGYDETYVLLEEFFAKREKAILGMHGREDTLTNAIILSVLVRMVLCTILEKNISKAP